MNLEDRLTPKRIDACVGCGKAISYDKLKVCLDCDTKYRSLIKEYIKNNRHATLAEVSQATGAPLKLVSYYEKAGVFHTLDTEMKLRQFDKRLLSIAARGIQQDEEKKKKVANMTGGYYFLTPEKLKSLRGR